MFRKVLTSKICGSRGALLGPVTGSLAKRSPVVHRFLSFTSFNRHFNSSAIAMSKNKKGASKGGNSEEAVPAVKLPEISKFEKNMDGTINWMTNEFAKLKVGRVSADLFTNLPVESYGTVGKAGQVTLKSNTKLVVSVYDPSIAKAVADAIRDCGLNLNPTIEGSNVMATIPRPSKESRDVMVKAANKLSEKVGHFP